MKYQYILIIFNRALSINFILDALVIIKLVCIQNYKDNSH
jgi:hypothetical protein